MANMMKKLDKEDKAEIKKFGRVTDEAKEDKKARSPKKGGKPFGKKK